MGDDQNRPGAAPRLFCARCRIESRRAAADGLCADCGERLEQQGYCVVCERFLLLPPGAACPKHDCELESEAPAGLEQFAADQWVIAATYGHPNEAEPPRIRLEAEGIPTFLEGDRMAANSLCQIATGGVKLRVPASLAADARIILAQNWQPPVVDDLDDAYEELAPEPGLKRRQIMKFVIILILLFPVVSLIWLAIGALVEFLTGFMRR